MNTLFSQPLKVVNAGLHSLADNTQHVGESATVLNWQSPAQDDIDVGLDLASLLRHPPVKNASQIAMARYLEIQPVLVDIILAEEVIPAMVEQKRILHSGPSVAWEEMCGPVEGAIIGAIPCEGWATSQQDAENQVNTGEIGLAPCHRYHAVGPMAGIISPPVPLWVAESKTNGHHTSSNFNEGLGRVPHLGTNNDEALNHLVWMRDEPTPTMKTAITQHGELELKLLMTQALHMGDEVHNRDAAAIGLLIKRLLPALPVCSLPQEYIQHAVAFITNNNHFFLSPLIAARKVMMDTAANIPFSPMVMVIVCNRVNFDIRLPGIGNRWFQAPANVVGSLFFPGFGVDSAAADLSDSVITETVGVGGFTVASSPAIVRSVGGTPVDTVSNSHRMQAITLGGNPTPAPPALNFALTAAGTDVCEVTDRSILPIINTGIAHKQAGVGQTGARITTVSMACSAVAVHILVKVVAKEDHHG